MLPAGRVRRAIKNRLIWILLALFFLFFAPFPELPSFIYVPNFYNLLEEKGLVAAKLQQECDLDYINNNRLQQDHPCVISYIRRHYLYKPSKHRTLNLEHQEVADPSGGQTQGILRILGNKTGGFFVECGALDGEYLSNTLYMERYLNWNGILIEADPSSFRSLRGKHRKSWSLPVCLSLAPYPTKVFFHINHALGRIEEGYTSEELESLTVVQCFPLYSILLAVNRTNVDFFSLDVEGHEAKVLQTIPWHKVNIKVLTIEWEHIPEGKEALKSFMSSINYTQAADFHYKYAKDLAFVKI